MIMIFRYAGLLLLSLMCLSGCGSGREDRVGILEAQYVDSEIILTVVLEDQYEIQLFEGDVGGNTLSTPAMEPTEVRYKIEDDKIWMGIFECNLNMADLKWRKSYPKLDKPTKQLQVATRSVNGQQVPISLRVVEKDAPGAYKTIAKLCGY